MHKCLKALFISAAVVLLVTACRNTAPAGKSDISTGTAATIVETTVHDQSKAQTQTQTSTTQQMPSSTFTPVTPGIRPVAVMIDNEGTRSLPQGGLNLAQVIYEVIVEGGETRLMPVFWGVKPEMIGPVRSSRHYFLDYAMENDAIYVHFGWSPMAKKDIARLTINNINGVSNGGEIFWDITKERGNWQDSYTSMKNIEAYAAKVKYRAETDAKPVFNYNSSIIEPVGGKQAQRINIRYSATYTCGYEYDGSTGLYNRIRKGKPQMERLTGKQLTAENIIIEFVPNNTIKGDKSGRQEVKTVGSGKGLFITCGKAIEISWSKDSRSSPTKYLDANKNPINLNPGQTWVQIVPVNGKVDIQ